MNNRTISYYNTHSTEYSEQVNRADMTDTCLRFLKHVPEGGSIVDLGCGSGRDMRFFKEHGYDAYGVDASSALCDVASGYSGCPVVCSDFLCWEPGRRFDAFWANASLLHLTGDEIIEFFKTKLSYLNDGGVVYFSMKKDIDTGYDEKGRFFTPFSEELLDIIMKTNSNLKILERWTQGDRLDRETIWESVILAV